MNHNYWTNEIDGYIYGVHLHEKDAVVIWGTTSLSNPHSEAGSFHSYQEFWAGDVDSFVRDYLGEEVLVELKAAVKRIEKKKS